MNENECYYAENDLKEAICGLHKQLLMERPEPPIRPGGAYPEDSGILICPESRQEVRRRKPTVP